MSTYSKGSEWRKWDLHIHTPASFYFNGTKKLREMSSEEKADELKLFIDTVNDSDVAVFCIMDYWNFDWYLELQDYLASNPGKLKKTVFPGMELRIESPTNYRLNIHVILSDKLSKQDLNDFKSELYILSINKKLSDEALVTFARSLDESKAAIHGYKNHKTLNDAKLLELGSKTAEITKESLSKAFNQIPVETGYVILPYDTSDGLLDLNWKDHPHADNYFMQSSQIFETRDQRNIDLISGIKTSENEIFFENFYKTLGNQAKPCISGSDAHKFSDYGKFPSKKITWIKADPTFEGLKQIIFEPKERIRIQETNPDNDFDKPLFTSIQIVEDIRILNDANSQLEFSKTQISLNRGLISIIGGRGQGKSMLINFLGRGLAKDINPKLDSKIQLNDNFRVEWKQGSEATIKNYSLGTPKELPLTFIYQSKIKEIADDNDVLKREIMEILNGAGFKKPFIRIDEFQIKETIQKYWNIKDWFGQKDDKGILVNNKDALKDRINSIKSTIELVSDGSNKLLLEAFVLGIERINKKKEENNKLRKLREKLLEFREALNEELTSFDSSIPPIDTSIQQKQIAVLYKRNLGEIYSLEIENKKIREEDFKDYKGDLSQLLSNLTNYQAEITGLEERVKVIDETQQELELLKVKLNEIVKEQLQTLGEEANAITETWNKKIFDNPERGQAENELIKKILADKNIKIEGTIFFNTNAFYVSAERFIDGRSLRPKSKEKIFDLLQLKRDISNDVLNYTIEKFEIIKAENYNCFFDESENDIFKIFIDPTIKNRYVQVVADITVDGKRLNELSAGQKGTVYLCLKLATQLFSGPIIFDQPEDDLDNEFITNQLIELFKEIKKYRQVIIVSHNANLVVNADSEQVIIANNSDESLSYESGSLENEKINREICRILEGGQRAFEKRRDKYIYTKD